MYRGDNFSRSDEMILLDFLGPPREEFPDDPTLGKYRVLDIIDSGGFAIVLRGFDDRLGFPVAIKVLKDRADQAARHRFKLEARSAGDLKEIRQIVRVLDVELEHQPPYFVMDYVPGEKVDKVGQLAPRDAARIALEVANGLAGMHEKKWVHQDIKPQNILVPAGDAGKRSWLGRLLGRSAQWKAKGDPDARILDLGLAFKEGPGASRPRGFTEAYASPEQLSPKGTVGTKSDVFSLGATLFHMLTGEPPSSRSEKRVCEQLGKRRIPPPLVRSAWNACEKHRETVPRPEKSPPACGRTSAAPAAVFVTVSLRPWAWQSYSSSRRSNSSDGLGGTSEPRGEPPRYGQS